MDGEGRASWEKTITQPNLQRSTCKALCPSFQLSTTKRECICILLLVLLLLLLLATFVFMFSPRKLPQKKRIYQACPNIFKDKQNTVFHV